MKIPAVVSNFALYTAGALSFKVDGLVREPVVFAGVLAFWADTIEAVSSKIVVKYFTRAPPRAFHTGQMVRESVRPAPSAGPAARFPERCGRLPRERTTNLGIRPAASVRGSSPVWSS